MGDAAARLEPLLVRFQNRGAAEADRDRRRALGTKALLILSTAGDGTAEWMRAGEALQRVLLRATAAGLFASYFSQPIQNPALRRQLSLLIGDRGVPHVMFRLGYGLEPRATPRRSIEAVLRRMDLGGRPAEALALRPAPAEVFVPPPFGAPALHVPQPRAPAVRAEVR
jgi:hypothetical protein